MHVRACMCGTERCVGVIGGGGKQKLSKSKQLNEEINKNHFIINSQIRIVGQCN